MEEVKRKPGRPKGIPKTGGRKPGVSNKLTRDVKEMILTALSDLGGVEYLKQNAIENPVAFMTLIGKVLPLTVAGDSDNPLTVISRIERVIVSPKD